MKHYKSFIVRSAFLGTVLSALTAAASSAPSASEIVAKALDADPFGLGGAVISARMVLTDKGGATSQLAFSGRSVRYDAPYSKSMVRFSAPADLAGAGFLQIQKRDGDDDRFLFLPELKRSRRIAGSSRASSFMGTDLSFADLDRRDFREGDAISKPDESIGKFACYRVDVTPKREDSPYSKIESWIRKDNMLPLKLAMYDKGRVLAKTFTAQEVKRVDGNWYVTRSRIVDHKRSHTTELILDSVAPAQGISDDEFTVRNLEKL